MDEMIVNRDKVIQYEQDLLNLGKENRDKNYLHLGCGKRIIPGFINVDKYVTDPNIINYDIFKLPYEDNYADLIWANHVLEHLPIRKAKLALIEWYRVLKPGSFLYLGMPDLDIIMRTLLNPNLADNVRTWYMYTLFGYQADSGNRDAYFNINVPEDYGQFHTCGYSIDTIKKELFGFGYKIEEIFSYDGYSTPSLFVRAYK